LQGYGALNIKEHFAIFCIEVSFEGSALPALGFPLFLDGK